MNRAAKQLLVFASLLCTIGLQQAWAEAPYEKYHVPRSSICASVLKGTIGVLTINSGTKKGTKLITYKNNKKYWVPGETVDAFKTKPVSNFGYHPPMDYELVGNFRYPILNSSGEHIKIAIDPIRCFSVWVSTLDLNRDFFTQVDYFESLVRSDNYIDPFFGARDAAPLVYKQPSLTSDSTPLMFGQTFKVMAYKDGFVEIGHHVGEEGNTRLESVGWLPIRDNEGLLAIWLSLVDNC